MLTILVLLAFVGLFALLIRVVRGPRPAVVFRGSRRRAPPVGRPAARSASAFRRPRR